MLQRRLIFVEASCCHLFRKHVQRFSRDARILSSWETSGEEKSPQKRIDLQDFHQDLIRNFSIIAHVDHGKSTLADRLLEHTGTIMRNSANKQVLDKLQVERERGITVKAQTASMIHTYGRQKYLLNLIDTPGHVDFSYEVSRSLAACQGVLLVVDAAQGVQAQTVANYYLATNANLTVIPVMNKIDLKTADPENVSRQMENVFGFDQDDILRVSAKTGAGIKVLLETVCNKVPRPTGCRSSPLKILLIDSWFDQYKGVICLVAVIDGFLKKGDRIHSDATKESYEVMDIGVLSPSELPTSELYAGQVGYVVTGMRKTNDALIGDTFFQLEKPVTPFPGFRRPKPMVFAGIYPTDQASYSSLRIAINKLTLNDSSVTIHPDNSIALGQGWRIGFLGLLHMDVFRQRLEQEYGIPVIVTTPNVPYKAILKGKQQRQIEIFTPSDFPDPVKAETYLEPLVLGTIIFPEEYMGKILSLCESRRGKQSQVTYLDETRIMLKYELPLSEIVVDFFDQLKSVSSGYASFDYEEYGYQEAKLSKMEVLLNGNSVDALSNIVHDTQIKSAGKAICQKLKETIPRQLYEVVIQATVRGKIIARETVRPFRKDVTAKCYGGDITRKRKLLEKQKEGKKKLKKIGNVELPHEAFLALLRRIVNAPCDNGICDRKVGKCNCFPCWTGKSCSIYANEHGPVFGQQYVKVKVAEHLNSSRVVGKVTATDADESSCVSGLQCPCAEVEYQLLDGADDTFSIIESSGEIVLSSAPYKDDYVLEVGATNTVFSQFGNALVTIPRVKKQSKMYVHIDTRNYGGRRIEIVHSRARRAVSAGSLVLTLTPSLTGKYYYDIGDQINFVVDLKHNASLTAVSVTDVSIRVSSTFLAITDSNIAVTSVGAYTKSASVDAGVLVLSLTGASFASGNTYTANFSTTVKNTIGPLSNLFVTAELNATTDVYIKKKATPMLFAVYPKVNLTRTIDSAVPVYGTKNFTMKMTFPKLNYSLQAELTTNIEKFIFMGIENVVVTKTGASVSYNGSATPKYHSTNNDGKMDRVVIDFGYVTNTASTGNTVDITFTVKVYDHLLLENNTLHWIGVGLQAGLRVLWVEQQAFYIIKEEPTLSASITTVNITTNSTRLFIGDQIAFNYTVKHTNTSTTAASNLVITCTFEKFAIPAIQLGSQLQSVNSTTATIQHGQSSLALGSTLNGIFFLQLSANVTPFAVATMKITVDYKNSAGVKKTSVTAHPAKSFLVGTPNILLSTTSTDNKMMPGQKVTFNLTVLLTKMRSPIRIELVMQTVSNASIYHIESVGKATIGSNIQGLDSSAQPILKSSNNDGINNLAIYDLGIGINTNADTSTSDANKVKLSFDVILVDHQNLTNGTSLFWVGAGLVGKPSMIWVGQIKMSPVIPIDSRPRLSLKAEIIEGTGSKTYPDYKYELQLKQHVSSTKSAYNVKIRFFLPEYVRFKQFPGGTIPRVTKTNFGGSILLEISGRFFFTDTINITFSVTIDETKFPHTGRVYITTPIYLLYKSLLGKQYTLVKVLQKFVDVPEKTIPTVTPVPEYYEKGFSWHKLGSNSYQLYICSNLKAQKYIHACYYTSDKGVTWHPIDSNVASVIGHSNFGDRFGISNDKLSYLKYDRQLKQWISINKADFVPSAATVVKLASNAASGDPAMSHAVESDHWGVSADGVFYKAGGVGPWVKKSIWL
eukprot:gene7243-8051_t